MAKHVTYIETAAYRGAGTQADPTRLIPQLWTLDGNLVAEYDPCGSSWFEPANIGEIKRTPSTKVLT